MLSRWQESAVNKKYKAKQEETAKLEGEVLSLSQQLENCRERLHAAEQEQLRSGQQVRELKNKLSERSNVFLSVEEGHDFSKTITELTEERSKLEERYFRVRAEQVAAQDMHDA
jgi:predicted  nucleic acid-binding Zn-ribbon protein